MQVDFEYNKQWVPQNLLNLEEVGQCAIEACNDDGMFFYLIVSTVLGEAVIASCGPVIPDVDEIPDGYCCSMYRMEYKEDKLVKTISMWLNHKDRKITEAKEVSLTEALDQFRDLGSYLSKELSGASGVEPEELE